MSIEYLYLIINFMYDHNTYWTNIENEREWDISFRIKLPNEIQPNGMPIPV